MYYVYFLSLITVYVKSDNCSSGWFEWHNNKCMFDCDIPYDVHVNPATLPFDVIANSCEDVRYSNLLGLCSTLNDLVWPDNICMCPSCACSTPNECFMGTRYGLPGLGGKSCFNCTCIQGTPSVYQCTPPEERYYVSSLDNWNDFTCQNPPILCTDSASGNTYRTGESWFSMPSNPDPDYECDTFCYCKANGEHICERGFDAIINSNLHPLVNGFYDGCGEDIQDCANDASRIVPATYYSSNRIENRDTAFSGKCPMCNCGSHAVGDVWFGEYAPDHIESLRQCNQYECYSAIYHNANGQRVNQVGVNTIYTINLELYPANSGYTCPEPNTISCHYDDGNDYDDTGIPSTISPKSLQPQIYKTNAPEAWCGWTYTHVDNTTGGIDGTHWSWGDGASVTLLRGASLCSIYGVNDACFYGRSPAADTCDITHVGTKWQTQYYYCCNDKDNCNWKDIDIDTCKESAEVSALFQNLRTCLSTNVQFCTRQEKIQPLPCSEMEKFNEFTIGCICEAYSTMYQDAPVAYKPWIESSSIAYLDLWRLQAWSNATGCNVGSYVQCDVTRTSENEIDEIKSTTHEVTRTSENEIEGMKSMNTFVSVGLCIATALLVLGVMYCVCKRSRRRPNRKEEGLIQRGQHGHLERIALDDVIEDHAEEEEEEEDRMESEEGEDEGENQEIVGTANEIDIVDVAPVQSD
eukprot:177923_1